MALQSATAEDMTEELLLELLLRIHTAQERFSDARFTYLIGNNGAGKSRMLAELAECLAKSSSWDTPHVACISNSLYDRFSRKYESPYIQYLGARNPDNAVFHASIDRSLCRMILNAMRRNPRLLRELERVLEMKFYVNVARAVDGYGVPDLSRLLDKRKLRTTALDNVFSVGEMRLLKGMMGQRYSFRQLDPKKIAVLLKLVEYNGDPVLGVERGTGNWIRFKDLSSGEQSQTLLFAKVLSVAHEGMTILIDEPEISLHLHWQMTFHKSLASLLSKLKRVHVVIATHAPVVISEAARHDPLSRSNVVMVLNRIPPPKRRGSEDRSDPQLTYRRHSFAQVASHEQLVLRYFDTAPYHTQAVSAEIAEAVLGVSSTDSSKNAAISSLKELRAEGMTTEAKKCIQAAISLLEGDVLSKLIEHADRDEVSLH